MRLKIWRDGYRFNRLLVEYFKASIHNLDAFVQAVQSQKACVFGASSAAGLHLPVTRRV